LTGLIVIDVVEGTALDALQGMQSILRGRPKEFPSLQNAIEWSVRSGQTRNLEAARVSMPGQLKSKSKGICATDLTLPTVSEPSQTSPTKDQLLEEDEDTDEVSPRTSVTEPVKESNFQTPSSDPLVWRIDLTKSERYWKGWFEGMSNFISSGSCLC